MSLVAQTVAVCGAGAMGSGIAQVAAQSGASVVVFDTQPAALDAGRSRVDTALEASVKKRAKLDRHGAAAVAGRIAWTQDLHDLAGADLTIEAIVEREDVKAELFAKLERVLSTDAVIASNTSSLPISRLAESLRYPGRFVGMHFFNPAPVMKLVEVVAGNLSRPEVVELVSKTATAWGKVAVPVADVPGFIVNRVARPFYAEAFRALGEGAASPQLIDYLFRDGGGFRMGPLELTDLIGQDVNYAVARSIHDAYAGSTRFIPEMAQASLVDAGRLGRKSNRGVFDYAVEDAHHLPTPEIADAGALKQIADSGATLADLQDVSRLSTAGEFIVVGDVLLGRSRGRLASSEARDAGRGVALFDWSAETTPAPLAFSASSDAAAAAAVALAAAAKRKAFRIKDRAGLLVLRSLAQLVNAASDAADENVATEDGIDAAMRFGVNYPFGLFDWANAYGRERLADVLDNIAYETKDDMYRASIYLRRS